MTRAIGAQYVIPREDEWYKAAYHANDGVTGNYFDYPTSSDAVPSNVLVDPDPGNNANYYDHYGTGNGDWTIGSPYWRTEVGEFEFSESPYGTFDMGGNVWERNEAIISGSYRGLRGGSFLNYDDILLASRRRKYLPATDHSIIGFRVAEVPEPTTMALLALGGLAMLRRRKGVRG